MRVNPLNTDRVIPMVLSDTMYGDGLQNVQSIKLQQLKPVLMVQRPFLWDVDRFCPGVLNRTEACTPRGQTRLCTPGGTGG